MKELLELIQQVEKDHFRTDQDSGADLNALFIWNMVRAKATLPPLTLKDLPSYCSTCDNYHIYPCSK